jgi:LacI family transcriptional regulator
MNAHTFVCMRSHVLCKDDSDQRGQDLQATQYDVARLTGLSQATISRALRGDPSVTEETRARIMAACAELGYRPSMGGRLLAQGQRAMMGISLSPRALPTDRYVSLLHQNLVAALQETGWGVTLLPSEDLAHRLTQVGALILIGVEEADRRLAACRTAGLPHVAIGYASGVFRVVPDDDGGPRLMVRHFHRIGRRRMAIMAGMGEADDAAGSIRSRAAADEARRLGLTVTHLTAERDATSTLSGYRSAMRSADKLRAIDCLFCDTDEHALGAVAAIRDLGMTVPDQISVGGFDDLPGLSRHLTTIRQDFAEIARTAIALTEEAREGAPPRMVTVPVELLVRET